jgi:catechol 2,3-dioxygenase
MAWPPPRTDGERVEMYTLALDMKDLMGEIEGEEPSDRAGEGLVVGHVHLHVGDVERALGFYRDVLGFEVMVRLPSAAFVSAGGYHHHLGFNVWLGSDVKPRPPDTAGLREWTVLLASRDEIAQVRARVDAAGLDAQNHDGGFLVRDPWDTAVVFAVG